MGNADNEQAIQANERGSKEDRREKLPIAEQSGSRRPEETSRDQPVALRGGSCERDFHSHEAGTRGSAEPTGRSNLAAEPVPSRMSAIATANSISSVFSVGAFYV
jgi:hypothetical protein